MPPARGAILLALAACSLRPYDFQSDLGSTTDALPDATTSAAATSTSTSTTSTSTTAPAADTTAPAGPASTGAQFIVPSDGWPQDECSIFEEDCPEGQKCMPDLQWSTTLCVPIAPNPAGLYEPCSYLRDSADTCDIRLMCWNVDENGVGECWGQCSGSPDAPVCADPESYCYWGRSALNLCIPAGCDPLLQDCDRGEACVPNPMDANSFICALDASGEDGQPFDPCEYANACDPGLLCANPVLAAECDPQSAGCCLPFCDLSGPACPGQDLECLAWYEDGQAPPGFENLGVCGLPQ